MPTIEQGKRLISYIKSLGYPVQAINIMYLEGVHPDTWVPNADKIDEWNDVRLLVRNTGEVLMSCSATTEPGLYYTQNPLNPNGAARIAFGYHKDAWRIGSHKGQDALVQCGAIKVHRDLNKDGKRTGDRVFVQSDMGLNMHSTGVSTPSLVGRHSAGCLVGRYLETHKKFMVTCRGMGHKTFSASVLDGSQFAAWKG